MRVSVIIPYHKRGEVFERGLDTVLTQEYPDREVIVVDDHSEDGLRERIEARQAGIKLIQFAENRGACAARNAGILAASGDVLAFIDDDAGFMSPFELTKLVKVFETHSNVQVIAFQICDPATGELRLRDWCHPRHWKEFGQTEFETDHFGEGSGALRREVFERAGLYYEPLFYGAEGFDLQLRILDQGFRILYAPQVRIWHDVSDKARTSDRQVYYFTRNYVWMAYKNYPIWAGMRFLAFKLAMMVYLTLRLGSYRSLWRGLRDGIKGLKRIRADRKPISRDTLRRWVSLEKGRPGILARMARHRAGPQL